MILPIHTVPDPILETPTKPIENITPEIKKLITDMRETMHNAHGLGLAAPQIGRSIALCVVEYDDPEAPEHFPFMALINPRITWSGGKKVILEEGCLSIPEVAGDVERLDRVRVKALNEEGQPIEVEAKGLLARALQHEIDHLNGVLFTKYVPKKQRRFRETPDYPRI